MAKETKILEYAKYVDNDNINRYNILKEKGVDVLPNQSLDYYTEKMDELLPPEENYVYINPLFLQLEKDWENDPLRTVNGGEYKYSMVFALNNKYNQTYININVSLSQFIIFTSDGQEITTSGSGDVTITWDTTKDIESDGKYYRWIKVYTNSTGGFGLKCPGYREKTMMDGNYPTTEFALFDTGGTIISQTQLNYSEYVGCHFNYVVFGESITENAGFMLHTSKGSLDVLKIRGDTSLWTNQAFSSGCFINKIIGSFSELKLNSDMILNVGHKLDLTNISIYSASSSTREFSCNLKEINLRGTNITNISGLSITQCLKLYLPTINTTARFDIIAYLLKDLTVEEDFDTSIRLYCPRLSPESFINLVNNLKDLTGEVAKTITIYKDLLGYVPDEVVETLINKNWTLSFI